MSWMNEWCIYLALYYVLLYTQSALQSCGGGGVSSTTTSVQHPLGWCDGCHRTTPVCSPHTSYRWREERVIEPIKWMGIIRKPWLIRASGQDTGVTPQFNVSSEKLCFLTVQCPRHYTGVLGPTQITGWAPPAGLTNFQQQPSFPRRSPIQVLTRLNPA